MRFDPRTEEGSSAMELQKNSIVKNRQAGFTLAEVMVSSAILMMVLTVVLTLFIASQRTLESAMAQVQLSFELRLLREKLLFNINGDGGLMNARFKTVKVNNQSGGWGKTLIYTPAAVSGASANVLTLSDITDKLSADSERSSRWLSSGQIKFESTRPFRGTVQNGELQIDADVNLEIGSRIYNQKQLIRSQLMAE